MRGLLVLLAIFFINHAHGEAIFNDRQKVIDVNEFVEFTLSDKPVLQGDEVWQKEIIDSKTFSEDKFLHFRLNVTNHYRADSAIWFLIPFAAAKQLMVTDGTSAWLTGDAMPFSTRPIKAPDYYFPLFLQQGESKQISGYMQGEILRYTFLIASPALVLEQQRQALQRDMTFFGAMSLLSIISIVMFLTTKNSAFLSFAFLFFMSEAWFFRIYGYTFELIWPNTPMLNDISYAVILYGAMISSSWVFLACLKPKERPLFARKVLISYTALLPICGLIAFFVKDLNASLDWPLLWFFPFIIIVTVMVIAEIKLGSDKPKWLCISVAPIFLGTIVAIMFVLGVDLGIDVAATLMQAYVISCFLLVSTTSFFLMKILKAERDHEKNQAIAIAEQAEQLELLVKDRTHALQTTNEKLEAMAHTDTLTQIPNRRSIDIFVDSVAENEYPIAIAMIDLDHFKRINDEYGHDLGDVVLSEVGNILRPLNNQNCVAGRFGGEEFAIVSKNTSSEAFEDLVKGVHSFINTTIIAQQASLKVCACIGWVECASPEYVTDAFKKADKALYIGKEQGRNKVVHFS